MKQYKYDNQRRVALSTRTWRRLRNFKKFNNKRSMEECILSLLDEVEYGIGREVL